MMRLLKYCLFLGFLMSIFSACADQPYSSAVPNKKPPEETPPSPAKPTFSLVSGIVDTGSPVSNARVSLYALEKDEIGRELGSSSTTDKGYYEIETSERFTGPCLIAVSGGEYLEIVSQKRIYLDSEIKKNILYAPIAVLKESTVANVNAWTTFAAARAMATRGQYDSYEKAIHANLLLMAKHLKRKEVEPESILTAKPVDILKSGLEIDNMNVLVTLTHYGLSELAVHRYGLNIHQLISILVQDLSNGRFDADGEVQKIASYLDSQTTRMRLVEGILTIINDFLQKGVTLGLELGALKQPDALFDSLASDDNPALYPPLERPMLYQQELDRPTMLYDISLKNKTVLEANKPISLSARIRSPNQIKKIDLYFSKIGYSVACTDPREAKLYFCHNRRDAEQLKTCTIIREIIKTPVQTEKNISLSGDKIHLNLNAQPGAKSYFFELIFQLTNLVEHTESFMVSELEIPAPLSEEEDKYCSQPHQLSKAVLNVMPGYFSITKAENVPILDWEIGRKDSVSMTWYQANNYCSAKHGGPWRLPTILELKALYEQKDILGDDDGEYRYWSSTLVGNTTKSALVLRFYPGTVLRIGPDKVFRVRCVR